MQFLTNLFGMDLREFLLRIPVVLIALVVHEVSHGYAAMKLGDPTARNLGRLTLNPLKHLDPIGAVCMVFFRFGWAKPVPINTRYFKNPKRDMALTALAGPLSNFIMGFGGVLTYRLLIVLFNRVAGAATPDFLVGLMQTTVDFFVLFAWMNVSLAIFNLIPIPPLDGSRIFLVFLPAKAYFAVMKYERFIMIGFFVFLFVMRRFPQFNPLSYVITGVVNGMDSLVGLIPGL